MSKLKADKITLSEYLEAVNEQRVWENKEKRKINLQETLEAYIYFIKSIGRREC